MSASDSGEPQFSPLRASLWPVHRFELKKLIPMLLIFFLISFDYNVLRTMKDTLVVTAKSSGAEVIPFIKVWIMFPGAILMTYAFTRLSRRMSWESVVYVMLGFFLCYFAFFTFVLYPMRDVLHPHVTADALQAILPSGFKGMIAMFRNWTFTSFYVMSELWSPIILTMLFWGFASEVTRLQEAKRFYGLFGIGANLSGIFAGQISVFFCRSDFNPNFPFGTTAWEQTLVKLVSLVIITGILAIILFRWMNTRVLTDPRFYDASEKKAERNIQKKLSMRDSLNTLLKSKYLISIAIVVIGYNIAVNLVEVVWKDQMKTLYPNPEDFNLYFNQVSTIIGIIATLSALLVSGNSIRKFGWTFTALLTPVVILITSFAFFFAFFMQDQLEVAAMAFFGVTPLVMVVFLGSLQNIATRAAKYSVYDATKEMAFIPLGPEDRLKGKAAIDGVCNRLGKSSGSLIHQFLLMIHSSIALSSPYVAIILFVVIIFWLNSTRALGQQFTELTSDELEPKENEALVGVIV